MLENRQLRTLLALCLLAFLEGQAAGQQTKVLKERFLREAPVKWQEYRAFAERLQGKCDLVRYKLEDPNRVRAAKPTYDYTLRIKQHGDWSVYVLEVREPADRLQSEVKAVNSRYAFELGKKDSGRPWVITDLKRYPLGGAKYAQECKKQVLDFSACSLLILHGSLLPELVNDPDFTVKGAEAVVHEGRELVRVYFADRPRKFSQLRPPLEGWVLLDPEHYWVVKWCDYKGQFPGTDGKLVVENSYRVNKEGYPIPTERMHHEEYSASAWEETSRIDYAEDTDVPEDEFSLSAFGFPEPEGREVRQPPRSRWYLGFLGVAAAFLGTGIWWLHRIRRRQAGPAAAGVVGLTTAQGKDRRETAL